MNGDKQVQPQTGEGAGQSVSPETQDGLVGLAGNKSVHQMRPSITPATMAIPVGLKGRSNGSKLSSILLILVFSLLMVVGITGVWWWLSRGEKVETVTINYWGLWEPAEVMQPLLDQYMSANPNVKVNYIQNSPEQYRQRLSSQMGSEDPFPDIFRFHNSWMPMIGEFLATVPVDVFSPEEYRDIFYPVIQRSLAKGAGYAGIPLYVDGLGLYYNEDLFTAGNQTPPDDWVKFREVAKKLTVKDESNNLRIAGAALGNVKNVDHWQDIVAVMLMQAGTGPADPNTPKGHDALIFHSLFTRVDKVWDETMPSSTLAFATGKLAMYLGPAREMDNIRELADENGYNLRFKVRPIPQLPEINTTWASFWAEGVSIKSSPKVQRAAWDLLAYLSEKGTLEQLYKLQVADRGFGMPYSRMDMAEQLSTHPQLGAFVLQMPAGRYWFLVSDTTDIGGINDRIAEVYMEALTAMATNGNVGQAFRSAGDKIRGILGDYGIR